MYRTNLQLEAKQAFAIHHQSQIMTIGSCFSQNIGSLMNEYKFCCSVNPFGVLYNPISIECILTYCLERKALPDNLYVQHNEIWSHYWLHSQHSSLSLDKLKTHHQALLADTAERLKKTDTLLITLGTAYVHELKEHQQIVANCHKVPSSAFEKYLLSIDDTLASLQRIRDILPKKIRIIYSLSPIRHTKEGLENNCLSKSLLRVALAEHLKQNDNCCYFPAYELLIDDLRDYRYYQKDMIHPNDQAIEYIWNTFQACFLDDASQHLIKKIHPLLKACHHKPFFPETSQHQTFLKKTIDKMKALKDIDFSKEIEVLTKQLA